MRFRRVWSGPAYLPAQCLLRFCFLLWLDCNNRFPKGSHSISDTGRSTVSLFSRGLKSSILVLQYR